MSVQCMIVSVIQVLSMQFLLAGVSHGQNLSETKFSIDIQNKRVVEIFKLIEQKTDYVFAYPQEVKNNKVKLSLQHDLVSLREVLIQISAKAKLKFTAINYTITAAPNPSQMQAVVAPVEKLEQQQIPISIHGVIKDDMGVALPGVNVLVKGTSIGTTSDGEGAYTLEVPGAESILVFSFIGFETKEVLVGAQTTLDVILNADTRTLQEIVVVGYGKQEKGDVTGSVSSIKSEDLKSIPVPNVSTAMQGRAAGVQVIANGAPGSDATFIIRGLGTINSTNPLLVIDGMPVASGLNTLNPDDIESVQILKDASAAAIYGSRGANGVVIVTTKNGKREAASSLSINFYTAVQQVTNLTEMLNSSEFAQLNNEMMMANGQPTNPAFADPSTITTTYDWLGAMFRSAPMNNLSVSYSGGSAKSNFHVSGNVLDQKGVVINTGYKRYSIQLNADHEIMKGLTFGHNLTLNHDIKTNGNYGIREAMAMVPLQPIYNADGSYSNPIGNPLWYGGMNNPIGLAEVPENATKGYNLIGSMYGEIEIVKGLKFRTNGGLQVNFWDTKNWNPKYDWSPTPQIETYLGTTYNKNINWLWDNTLTYDTKLNDIHHLTVLVGTSAQENYYSYNFASRQGFASDVTQEINSGGKETLDNGGSASEWSLFSYFGRLNYTYKDRYLLTATVRRDGSSKFGANNRFGTFPSFSAAWRISEEPFFQNGNLTFIQSLKLRGGYGETGNQDIGSYQFASVLVTGQYNFNDQLVNSVYPLAMSNPNIQWETVKQTNLALDVAFLDGRIDVTVEGFVKDTDDMLVNAPVPISTGYNPSFRPSVNAGKMTNRGIELTIGTKNTTGALVWNTDFNLTYLQNQIVSLNDTVPISRGGIGLNMNLSRLQNGHPMNAFFGHVTNGVFQSQEEVDEYALQTGGADIYNRTSAGDIRFMDLNNDGVINDDDRTYIGNPNPKFIFAMNNTFTYKNFDMSVFIQGEYDKDIFNANLIWQEGMGAVQNQTKRVISRWVGEGTSNEIPRAVYGDPNKNARPSDRFIEDGSYVRIKNVTLGYSLPKSVIQRIHLTRARFYFSAQNLYTFTNYSGNDPEVGVSGIDLSVYPVTRTLSVGANLTF